MVSGASGLYARPPTVTFGSFEPVAVPPPVRSRIGIQVTPSSGDVNTVVVIPNYRHPTVLLTKARATLFVLTNLGWPWKAAAMFRVLPTSVLDAVYDLIARHRYRMFGRRDHCVIPRPEHRPRFLESLPDVPQEADGPR